MSAPLTVRTATEADRDALRGVFRRSALHWESDRDWLLANPHHLEWDGAHLAAGRTLVAERGAAIVGFAAWAPSDGGWELIDLFVDPPAMRGGGGRALIAAVVARARAAGIGAIEVTGNPDALPFYRAAGFAEIGTAPTARAPAPRLRLAVR